MTGELALSVLHGPDDDRGRVTGLCVTDQQIVAVGRTPAMALVSEDGRRFAHRATPGDLGLCRVLAVGDSLWVCGERGLLAVSRDHGGHWQRLETATEGCLRGLALGGDGAIWVVGDAGYAARVLGEQPRQVDVGTAAVLASVHAVRDELVMLGGDGVVTRWRDGKAVAVACGASRPLTALAVTGKATWVVVGAGGFVARSPDGTWYSRVDAGTDVDLEAVIVLPDATLLAVGDRGRLLRSIDDARTWRPISGGPSVEHLWSIARFGAGALIGGDRGLICQLAPVGDATRRDPTSAVPDDVPEAALDAAWEDVPAVGQDAAREAVREDVREAAWNDAPGTAREAAWEDLPEAGLEASCHAAREAELDRTPPARWAELAWQWLDDGVGHRALLARLDRTQGAQIAAIDELRDATADERAIALPRIAAELSPELEAVLVGSLVRDDALDGAPGRPRDELDDDGPGEDADGEDPDGDDDGGDDDDLGEDADDGGSPGWEAIDRALAPLYADSEPLHYGTAIPYEHGGNDPIHGISVYARMDPRPHWHFVTYGFTDLFRKETDDPDESGYGFELTLRLVRAPDDARPPTWALNFLQNLGRYVFGTGNLFAAGHKMGLNGPIALDHDTGITAICFADDPELGELSSPFGKARFVQIVGITDDEYRLIQEWSTTGLVEILADHLPLLVTDLGRSSVLDDPAVAAVIRERVDREGSSEDLTFAGELKVDAADGQLRVELGALYAATLPRAMRGRIRHGRRYELRGREAALQLEPGDAPGYRLEDRDLVLELTPALASEIAEALRDALAGTYRFAVWPRLTIVVTPSIIRGQDGSATEVRGVADPAEAARIIAADNARLAAAAASDAAGEPDDDRDDDDEHDDDESDDGYDAGDGHNDAPAPAQIASALAMTGRALRLAPGDEDVQFAHAMLLLDAERAGDPAKADELLAQLPAFVSPVRVNIAVRMAKADHPRFGEAVEQVLADALPVQLGGGSASGGGARAALSSFTDMAHELFGELGEAILERSPRQIARLVPVLPDDAKLLSELAHQAIEAGEREAALALYDRVLALAIPDEEGERATYLRALNNACVQAHEAGAYDAAARIADRAQPVAHENPYLYHAAACAYAAVRDYARAFEQVKLAVEHDYEHIARIETDADLGPLLDWPELQALFRDWHAHREGN
jgi:hypothetical protein